MTWSQLSHAPFGKIECKPPIIKLNTDIKLEVFGAIFIKYHQ